MIREAGSGRVGGSGEIRHRPGSPMAAAVCDGTVCQLQTGSNYAVSNLLSIITTPFYVSAIVVYYFDLRVAKREV